MPKPKLQNVSNGNRKVEIRCWEGVYVLVIAWRISLQKFYSMVPSPLFVNLGSIPRSIISASLAQSWLAMICEEKRNQTCKMEPSGSRPIPKLLPIQFGETNSRTQIGLNPAGISDVASSQSVVRSCDIMSFTFELHSFSKSRCS